MKQKKHNAFILITTIIVTLIFFSLSVFFTSIVKLDYTRVKDIGYNTICYYTGESGFEYIKAQMGTGNITSYDYSHSETFNYDGGITAEFKVTAVTAENPDGFNAYSTDESFDPYKYDYTIESTAKVKRKDTVIAEKTLISKIKTTAPVLNGTVPQAVSAYSFAIWEKYR